MSTKPAAPRLRLLHLHSSFSPGGKELRAAKLMNAFGAGIDHTIVSAVPGELGAASAVDPAISVHYPDDFPALAGRPWPRRLMGIAQAMRGFASSGHTFPWREMAPPRVFTSIMAPSK